MKRLFGLLTVFSLGITLSSAQPVMPLDSDVRTFDTQANGIDQKLGNILPLNADFTDETGKRVKLGDFFKSGKPVILVPVWYQCEGTCILTLDGMVKSFIAMKKDQPGKGFEVITFSIKPTETPAMAQDRKNAVLTIYNKPGVPEAWHFLTGDLDNIRKLTAAVGFRYTWNPTLNKINHPAGIMIITPEGKVSNYIYGTEYAAALVTRYLDKAKKNEVATQPAPVVLLGCFEFDPHTGKTRLIMWRAVQIGGIATVLVLFGSIAFMSYRYKQKSPVRRRKGGNSEG